MNMTDEKAMAVIEALLFTMGDAVSAEAMAAVMELDTEEVIRITRQLQDRYQSEGRGIRIVELDGSFQMCTDPSMYDYINALTHRPKKYTLTNVMLETLAIIAYRQPVTRSEIERIRGVSCMHPINRLLEYGLITEAGRLNAPGRPILFATTEEFLRAFGISSPKELPEVSEEDMKNFAREAEKEADTTVDV